MAVLSIEVSDGEESILGTSVTSVLDMLNRWAQYWRKITVPIINLKIKKPKWEQHMFIWDSKDSYSQSTDSVRNPNSVPISWWRQGVFMKKGREIITWIQERSFWVSVGVNKLRMEFHRCRKANIVLLILKNVFDFQLSNHNVYFPVMQYFLLPLQTIVWNTMLL